MPNAIRIDREVWEQAVEVADGFWILATHHRPAFSKMMPSVNNRCLIFRVREEGAGKPVLLVANGVDPRLIPEVRRLERETGLDVRYILSVGGGHHVMLPPWRDEFSRASVLVGPERVPRTPSARKLMEGGRVRVMDRDNPLPEFSGQLDAVVFHGINGVRDHATPAEGGKEMTFFSMMRVMSSIDDPTDELWLHHVPTDTVIAGDNLGWFISKETLKTFPLMMRMMMKANALYVQDKARKVADAGKVAQCWSRILSWPSQTLMGYHEPSGEAFVGDARAALTEAVKNARQLASAAA